MQEAVKEYKQAGEVTISFGGQSNILWLGPSKSHERRRRNTTIRRLADYAASKGAKDVTMCWWSGAVLSGGKRLCAVLDNGAIDFVEANPYLKAMGTQQHLVEQDRIFRSYRDWQ